MVHRKVGLRPEKGQEVTVRPGEVVVAFLPFRARYIARPAADFTNTRGMPVRSTTFRAVRMVNNQFCTASGTKCFNDKDRAPPQAASQDPAERDAQSRLGSGHGFYREGGRSRRRG